MKLGSILTLYKTQRDYSNDTGFFIVDVREAYQYGIGFQLRLWNNWIIGISVHTPRRDTDFTRRRRAAKIK